MRAFRVLRLIRGAQLMLGLMVITLVGGHFHRKRSY
jgi:hypothetical protein